MAASLLGMYPRGHYIYQEDTLTLVIVSSDYSYYMLSSVKTCQKLFHDDSSLENHLKRHFLVLEGTIYYISKVIKHKFYCFGKNCDSIVIISVSI